MYKYSCNTKFVHNEDIKETIILNRKNGTWMKIPNVWKEIMDRFIKERVELVTYLNYFSEELDKKTFTDLFNNVLKFNFVVDIDKDEREKLEKIQFAITERCNLKCTHCCYDATQSFAVENNDLSFNNIALILDKIIDFNPESLTISGGEPMIRDDFFEILRHLKERYSGKVTLSTNATLIKDSDIPFLADFIASFDISLDGVDEESCAHIRGKGVFGKVLKIVAKLQKAGAENITLSMVDMNNSEEMRNKFKQLNDKLGTKSIIRALTPIGRASVTESRIEYQNKLYSPREIKPEEFNEISSSLQVTHCGALRNQFFINYDGSIYPCGILIKEEYNMGNILDYSYLDDILLTPNRDYEMTPYKINLLNLEPDRIKKCKDCKINFFCWHCLQEVDMAMESESIVNHRCQLKKEHIGNLVW